MSYVPPRINFDHLNFQPSRIKSKFKITRGNFLLWTLSPNTQIEISPRKAKSYSKKSLLGNLSREIAQSPKSEISL